MPRPFEPPVDSPTSLAEAYPLLVGARPIAGGTDLMVQITGELGEPPERVVDLWGLQELRGIRVETGDLVIGALSTYADIQRSDLVRQHVPVLADVAATIGAAQIQNRGTLGGNIVNASPAGDTLPVLLAVDARIALGSLRGQRDVAAADFWPAYRQTARGEDELVLAVRIPVSGERLVRFRKIGTRRAQAISKVVMAVSWTPDGARWSDVRLALGSVAATPVRARQTESVLEGSEPSAETAERAVAALEAEISPIDDVRSTAAYRLAVAGRVLHRLIRDEGGW